jgi:hypothetical protein
LARELEFKSLIKTDKRGKINLLDSLNIDPFGRIDAGELGRKAEQNTFWLKTEFKDGFISNWLTFDDRHVLRNRTIESADRQFPVTCMCELFE